MKLHNNNMLKVCVAILGIAVFMPACATGQNNTPGDMPVEQTVAADDESVVEDVVETVEEVAATLPEPTREAQPFELPALPYDYDALEPHIDAETMTIHHTFHHQGYVNNLNNALADYPELLGYELPVLLSNLEAVPEDIRTTVRNNGGGHFNHELFWNTMSADGGGEPEGALAEAIVAQFESVENLKALLKQSALTRFGSGWAWLVVDADGQLQVMSTPNQDTPFAKGATPILGIDVWEHAYYLKFRNRRGEYVDTFFNVVDWNAVAENYENAL